MKNSSMKNSYKRWTEEEDDKVKKFCRENPRAHFDKVWEFAKSLGRTEASLRTRIKILKMKNKT